MEENNVQEIKEKIKQHKLRFKDVNEEQMNNPEVVKVLLEYGMTDIYRIMNKAGKDARNNEEVIKKALEKIEAKRERYSDWAGDMWKLEDNTENPDHPHNLEELEAQLTRELKEKEIKVEEPKSYLDKQQIEKEEKPVSHSERDETIKQVREIVGMAGEIKARGISRRMHNDDVMSPVLQFKRPEKPVHYSCKDEQNWHLQQARSLLAKVRDMKIARSTPEAIMDDIDNAKSYGDLHRIRTRIERGGETLINNEEIIRNWRKKNISISDKILFEEMRQMREKLERISKEIDIKIPDNGKRLHSNFFSRAEAEKEVERLKRRGKNAIIGKTIYPERNTKNSVAVYILDENINDKKTSLDIKDDKEEGGLGRITNKIKSFFGINQVEAVDNEVNAKDRKNATEAIKEIRELDKNYDEEMKAYEEMSDEELYNTIKAMAITERDILYHQASWKGSARLANQVFLTGERVDKEKINEIRQAIKEGNSEEVLSNIYFGDIMDYQRKIAEQNDLLFYEYVEDNWDKIKPEDQELWLALEEQIDKYFERIATNKNKTQGEER